MGTRKRRQVCLLASDRKYNTTEFGHFRRRRSTATGIRTPVSAVRGRRPSPLDDGGSARDCSAGVGPAGRCPLLSRLWLFGLALCCSRACWVRGRVPDPGCRGVRLGGRPLARRARAPRVHRPPATRHRVHADQPDRARSATRRTVGHHGRSSSRRSGLPAAGRAWPSRDRAARRPRASRASCSRRCSPTRATTAWWTAPTWIPAAFPSGHATAAMSLALAGVLVAPPRARPFAAVLGMAFAISISFAWSRSAGTSRATWLGGFLLATGWTLVIAAALRYASERWPERAGRTTLTATLQRAADWRHHRSGSAAVTLVAVRRGVSLGPSRSCSPGRRAGGLRRRAHRARGGGGGLIALAAAGRARRRDRRAAPRLAGPRDGYAARHQSAGGPGKSGASPARSRHCERALKRRTEPLGSHGSSGKARRGAPSQETWPPAPVKRPSRKG